MACTDDGYVHDDFSHHQFLIRIADLCGASFAHQATMCEPSGGILYYGVSSASTVIGLSELLGGIAAKTSTPPKAATGPTACPPICTGRVVPQMVPRYWRRLRGAYMSGRP